MRPEHRAATVQSLGFLLVSGAVLIGAAGRLDLWNFWAYLAIFAVVFAISLATVDSDLIRERMRPGGRRPVRLYLATILAFAHFAVAGLDRGRMHWSNAVPPSLVVVGLVLFAAANLAILWIMRLNRFFSSIARLQRDRGQTVIAAGPYAWVRHPGYASALLLIPASGLALGSWLALLIAFAGLPALLWRTIGEDRMLRKGLDGYDAYARRVRWRLIPGIW